MRACRQVAFFFFFLFLFFLNSTAPSHKVHDTLLGCFSADPTPIPTYVYTYFFSGVSYITNNIELKRKPLLRSGAFCDFF
jgi:hypothetical protein